MFCKKNLKFGCLLKDRNGDRYRNEEILELKGFQRKKSTPLLNNSDPTKIPQV